MLVANPLSSPLNWSEHFEKIDFQKETLIISNLRTKKEIQNLILKKQSYFEDHSVLRISDFWKILAYRSFPDHQILSADLAAIYIRRWLKQEGHTSFLGSSAKTFYQMLVQLGPLYMSESSLELWQDWQQENQNLMKLISPWLPLVQSLISSLRQQKKILLDWVPALVHGDLSFEKKWDRPLWIDLGAELTSTEAAVFETLGSRLPIRLFYPKTSWTSQFSFLLKPYENMVQGNKSQNDDTSLQSSNENSISTIKLSSRLSEVRNAVAQIREWADSGIPLKNIAVLSAQIEKYWPILKSFMDVEGLPAQKKQVHSLVARWTVMNWLSRLQVQSKSLETSDYEVQFYNPFEQKTDPALSYDEFLSFFKNLYDEQDLQRWKKLGQFVKSEYKEGEILNRDQFILHAYSHWSDQQETSDLETIYKEILKSVDEKFELTYKDWVDWAEKIATQKEKTITDSIDDGVEIGSLMSDHSVHVTHRIFLGVCEEDFRTTSISFVSSELRNKITQDLGFSLEDPEQNFKHFQVRWLLQRKSKQTILSIGLTDFDGALLTPLSLWYQYPGLDSNGGELVSASYKESRWDRLQKLPLHEVLQKERKHTEIFIQSMQSRIEMDGGLVREPSSVTTVQTISPSRIESYLKCPFIYKSQKVYRLSASPEIDIDVDPMTRGQFVHEMFEKILTNLKSDWSDQKINELIESIKVGRQLDYYQDQLWLLQKRKYFHLAQKFINFEKRWHQQYPEAENHKTEIKWSVGFDFTQKIFKKTTAQDLAGVVEMNGQIDRIDISTHQQISVIDYKSSLPITSSFTKWIEKNNLQLIFYAWVVDRGFVDGINGEMVNASYYNFKDFSRDHGFQLEQAREKFLPTDLRPSQKMTEESKSNLFEEFEKKLIEVMGKIQAGEFQPQPFDLKECVECEWKKLCRAPHLN